MTDQHPTGRQQIVSSSTFYWLLLHSASAIGLNFQLLCNAVSRRNSHIAQIDGLAVERSRFEIELVFSADWRIRWWSFAIIVSFFSLTIECECENSQSIKSTTTHNQLPLWETRTQSNRVSHANKERISSHAQRTSHIAQSVNELFGINLGVAMIIIIIALLTNFNRVAVVRH